MGGDRTSGKTIVKKTKKKHRHIPDRRKPLLAASAILSVFLAAAILLFFVSDFRNHTGGSGVNPPNVNRMADLLFIYALPGAILFLVAQTMLLSQILARLNGAADDMGRSSQRIASKKWI